MKEKFAYAVLFLLWLGTAVSLSGCPSASAIKKGLKDTRSLAKETKATAKELSGAIKETVREIK